MHKSLDYVTRRFNASSAELKKPEGAGPSLEPPLSAIARSTWNPESAGMRSLVGTSLPVRVLLGSVQNWIAVNNPMPKKKWRRGICR